MSKEQTFRDCNLEEELQRAKWFKEDLYKRGWGELYKDPDVTYWIKNFHGEEMPLKILFSYVFPTSVKEYTQLMDPLNMVV